MAALGMLAPAWLASDLADPCAPATRLWTRQPARIGYAPKTEKALQHAQHNT